MIAFNLHSYLTKEAMGSKRNEYREISDWWTLDQILEGDEKWNAFAAELPDHDPKA